MRRSLRQLKREVKEAMQARRPLQLSPVRARGPPTAPSQLTPGDDTPAASNSCGPEPGQTAVGQDLQLVEAEEGDADDSYEVSTLAFSDGLPASNHTQMSSCRSCMNEQDQAAGHA